jgi:hypothetical protein
VHRRKALASELVSVALTGTLMSWEAPAQAQVNVEPFREQLTDEGFAGRLRASAASYAGNTRGVVFGSAGIAGVREGRYFAYLVLTGDYTRLNGEVSVAKWFAHARHDYRLAKAFWWEQYAQLESDRFRRVRVRALAGTGPRWNVFDSPTLRCFYGISFMYEHTDLETNESGGRGEGGAVRLSNYATVTLRAQDRILLSVVTYAQPRIDRPDDVVVLSVSSADFTITPLLHSRLDATVRYDSVTPADVHAADVELKSALELVF